MRALICHQIDNETAGTLLYALQLSTTNLAYERDVFPPPEEEDDNRPMSLAEILITKLRDDAPCFHRKGAHGIFHEPHSNPEGYPEIPPPIDLLPPADGTTKRAGPNT